MPLDRRQFLAASGACLASCGTGPRTPHAPPADPVDRVLAANAVVLPERAGAGANHYPMAAEALEALGRADAIPDVWTTKAPAYAGEAGRAGPIAGSPPVALGRYDRYGDWLDLFAAELAREPWRAVVARWVPRLAPGLCGGMLHGVIRTGHAARALRRRETGPRRAELACALAYWAARYRELPAAADPRPAGGSFRDAFAALEPARAGNGEEVTFFSAFDRPVDLALAPAVSVAGHRSSPRDDLTALVRAATEVFLEMLTAERHRILMLHAVTGPAAVGMLLADVDARGARRLVEHAWQAAAAMVRAHGQPFAARDHVRATPAGWPELVARATASRSVHSIKLIEALARFDEPADPLCRSAAETWLEWV